MRWFWFFCLTWAAVSDLKTRSISCHLLAVCGIAGMIWAWRRGPADCVAGLPAGCMLLALSRITKGGVGSGDGWFVLASAGYLTVEEIWGLLLGGMGVGWVWSIGLILYRVWTKSDIHRDTIPLLTCMWPVGLLMLI
ncbi:MAG: hypothetical protein HFG70_08825 [Hungatella sp.]|nr:hypothetical protein [Hungatella sp.]